MSLPRFFIYGLLDPDSYEIRYIGQSAQGILRFNNSMHISSLKIDSPKSKWINQLISQNKIPLFKILQVCEFEKLNDLETFWISKNKNLLNIAKGGEGGDTGRAHRKWKPVISKNLENGETKEYLYVWEVEKDGFSPSKVSAVCLGKRKSHRGHIFKHKDVELFSEYTIFNPQLYLTKKNVKRTCLKSNEEVFFDSIKKAAEDSSLCITTISNCCRGKSKCRNYKFEYVNDAVDKLQLRKRKIQTCQQTNKD